MNATPSLAASIVVLALALTVAPARATSTDTESPGLPEPVQGMVDAARRAVDGAWSVLSTPALSVATGILAGTLARTIGYTAGAVLAGTGVGLLTYAILTAGAIYSASSASSTSAKVEGVPGTRRRTTGGIRPGGDDSAVLGGGGELALLDLESDGIHFGE